VVGLGTWELRRRGRDDEGIVRADSPEEAAEMAMKLAAAAAG